MITRLEVDGFKSLRNFTVDLEPFTVLVGPNDAGKSNILEALTLAAQLDHTGPEEALRLGRGTARDKFSRHGSKIASKIHLALECLERPYPHRFLLRERYELTLQRATRTALTERVDLDSRSFFIHSSNDRWLADHPEWGQFVANADVHAAEIHSQRPTVYLIHLDAAHLRTPSERIDSGRLAPDASNLPSVLAALSDPELGQIRASLAALIPGIRDFDIKPDGDDFYIEFRTREGERVPARLASDGTLRMLALLTVVVAPPVGASNSVVCIEEPENGIYPGRLSRLIGLLRDATSVTPWLEESSEAPPLQVLLTTHSPIAIDALRSYPESLRFVDSVRADGVRATRARRTTRDDTTDHGHEVSLREIDATLRTIAHEEEP